MKQEEKRAINIWNAYVQDVHNGVPADAGMSLAERKSTLMELEANPVEWMKFFFPNYAKYEFAQFHLDFIHRAIEHEEWYEVLSWSRELAKSTVTMMVTMYLALTGRKKNILLASATQDSAIKLLKPYMDNMESNGRIRAFYGEQPVFGQWKEADFKCQCGASFMGIGAGNSPRGTRNGNVRPDVLLVDDFDTDEDCRNEDILDKKWDWWEHALYPTRSISEPTLVVFCGNIISQDCCVKRAGEVADHWDIVNIRDAEGHSTWPEKNTEEHIDRVLNKISVRSAQAEYFNNPIAEGKIFRNCQYAECPPLSTFRYLICYGDPSYSNNKKSNTSMKALVLLGFLESNYYVIKCFVDHCTNAEFMDEYFKMKDYVGCQCSCYYYMENNKLQDPFFQQVFKPLLRTAIDKHGTELHIIPDERKKTDKATRIEANLEPLDREGMLLFNSQEKNSPYMQELINQFRLFDMRMPYCADGPDAVEGAVTMFQDKNKQMAPTSTISINTMRRANRFGF